ncbi:MAG: histidine phosphatase family protein [Steroidobacteraceae bacterium]
MMRLTLVRHAQADNPLPDQQDWDRPLTRRGLLDGTEMARRAKELRATPPLILSSPAVRTRQTAELFAKALNKSQLQLIEDLYLASAKQLLISLQQQADSTTHLMVVGHNPGISELADKLSDQRRIDGMPTASVVTMEFSITTWQDLRPATGLNVEFDYPQRPA